MAALLDGRALISGGLHVSGPGDTASVIFDPATDRFESTGPMGAGRFYHALVTLRDGRVLAAGGRSAEFPSDPAYGDDGLRDDAEIYDPATGVWTPVGRMPGVRGDVEARLLPDGRVLIALAGDRSTAFSGEPGPQRWTSTIQGRASSRPCAPLTGQARPRWSPCPRVGCC